MGTQRVRSSLDVYPADDGGYALFTSSGTSPFASQKNLSLHQKERSTTDVIGDPRPYPIHPFHSEVMTDNRQTLDGHGENTTTGWHAELSNFRWWASNNRSHLSTDIGSIGSNDFSNALARTNPSRPGFVPLDLLQDVIDLPRMLKDVGRLATAKRPSLSAKDLANRNLAVQFGWMPLVQDIHDLMTFAQRTDNTFRRIRKFYDRGGTHSRVDLGSGIASTSTPKYFASTFSSTVNPSITISMDRTTTVRKWATCRWKPTSLPNDYPDSNKVWIMSKRIASGLTPEGILKGAWDLIPWSFLVDWFGHYGSYLTQYSNTVPAVGQCCVMRSATTSDQFRRQDSRETVVGGEGVQTYVTHDRSVGALLPTASFPVLNGNDLSILGSLFIQRFK